MFQFFRNFFKTKLGLAISLAFLGLIALAFASADVSSTGTFGGIAGGDRVAVVGDEKNEGVVNQRGFFQFIKDHPHHVIEASDRGTVGGKVLTNTGQIRQQARQLHLIGLEGA